MQSDPCESKTNFYDNKIPKMSCECICECICTVTAIGFIYKYAGSK